MKQFFYLRNLRIALVLLMIGGSSLCFLSFTAVRVAGDFLQQLGISKDAADKKITSSLLGGYLDQYGLRNAKNIASGDRAAVVKDLVNYARQYVNSDAYLKEYSLLRESNKPKPNIIQTPEEMRTGLIEQYRKSITETEANMKKADASMKSIFEPILVTMKQQLKEAEDPANKMMANYKKNYDQMVKSNDASYQQRLQEWESKYPAKQTAYIKMRLKEFMDETSNIDYGAQLTEKNGRQYFVNPSYEHKGNRWKMAFRAGKDAVETARTLVQAWMDAI